MRIAKLLLLVALVGLMVPTSSWADVVWTSNGFTITASGVAGGFYAGGEQFTFTIENNSGVTGWFQGLGFKGFTSTTLTGAHMDSGSASATPAVGFNNGSGSCSGADSKAFCLEPGLPGTSFADGTSLTYIVSVGGATPLTILSEDLWHLQILITDGPCSATHGNPCSTPKTLVALSTEGTPSTPEPASLTLLGAGMLGWFGLRRIKR